MRFTNPIWRLAQAFGQLDSWNEKKSGGGRRRSRQEVRRLVDEFEASGLQRWEFCQSRSVQASIFAPFYTYIADRWARSRQWVNIGNLVQADSTPLTTVISIDPIYAYFSMDELAALRYQRLLRQ